ncbi:kynureninase [Snodgrassella sp. B3882]|uniref:kynureninase n=1 Tax=Snodgrassella sp. B3882 TaxID=2818037 RepID=UPI002269F272|nr:kynureninase [Snodgrassella sp. B3882]MCX8745196.1 kynureninase [Snodgrassella sp. B3882]
MITFEQCQQWDAEDELANLKSQFDLPQGVIYLDGNSLGAKPIKAMDCAQQVINQQWGTDLINSWNKAGWWDLPVRLGNKIGQLVGARENETVVTDTTSMNLFKVLATAIGIQQQHPTRKTIIAERDSFPTDLYMIEGFMALINQGYKLQLIDQPEDLPQYLDEQTAVVVLSHVNYRTGYLHDMAAVNQQAHAQGALIIWDLCHSIGAVPIDLNGSNSDFAIGCTYKYLNGGPGSPAMLWVHSRYQTAFNQPLSGWWGHAKPFAMDVSYTPADNVRRYLCGTQPIVSMSLVECGVDIFLQTDMQALRQKSLRLTDVLIQLLEQECAGYDLTLITPREHLHRGSHISVRHPHGYAIVQALIARGVIGDYREPEVIRLGVTPLYLSFCDIWQAVQHLKQVLVSQEWAQPQFQTRRQVT